MAYMFRDEVVEEGRKSEADAFPPNLPVFMDEVKPKSITEVEDEKLKPITHWGSDIGIVKHAELVDSNGAKRNVYTWGEKLKVIINFSLPQYLPKDN
ncbi:ABC transporter ATP-binding protein, partial [Paraburkholderia sp. JPY454]|nr:ABC transporter ATP-binding protein [Paraburkholderia youngii]